MTFWTKVRKSQKIGVFLALKAPGGREPEFFGIRSANCTFITNVSTFWRCFGKSNGYMKKLYDKKFHFEQFGAFYGLLLSQWGMLYPLKTGK